MKILLINKCQDCKYYAPVYGNTKVVCTQGGPGNERILSDSAVGRGRIPGWCKLPDVPKGNT